MSKKCFTHLYSTYIGIYMEDVNHCQRSRGNEKKIVDDRLLDDTFTS